jgi:predicted transcriptional regulator
LTIIQPGCIIIVVEFNATLRGDKMNNELLVRIIDSKGLKKQFIAKQLGVRRETLYNKLTGKTDFTATEIKLLAKLLSLSQKDVQQIFFS